jgi:hypothetical protein
MLRWVFRAGLGLGVLGILGALLGLTGVDRAPFEGRPYAEWTRQRFSETATGGSIPTLVGEVRAGFGRVKLTPTTGAAKDDPERGEFRWVPLAGYGSRQGKPATGVREDVWVKAVAFAVGGQTGVVVTADALIIPREVAEATMERLRGRLGLERRNVYFGATHTHCGLGGWGQGWVGEAFAGGYQPGVRVWMARQLAEAAVLAVTDLAPARVGRAAFGAPDFTRNRLVGDRGTIDSQFSLLDIRKIEGGGRAVIGSFAAHATVLSSDCLEFSGDYPGFWQRAVEGQGVTLAMFLAGAVGSHSPKPPAGGTEGAQRMGEALAERTGKALAEVSLTNRIAWSMTTLEVRLPELQARLTEGVRLRPWVARLILPVGHETRLQAWRLGDALWLSTPCDYSGELALELKSLAHTKALHAVVTSFNGDYVGYVVPSKYYGMSGYEPRVMSFFGPQLPDYFDALLKDLIRAAGAKPSGSGL